MIDGLDRDEEARRDLRVGEALADQREDLVLATGESERVGAGGGPWPGRHRLDPEAAHLLPDHAHRCCRAESGEGPGLAAQQDETALPVARLVREPGQVGQCRLPFQQLHAASVR